ncbi:DUF4124 domain-containing protein [Formivibrio citricus]|nr:DUF4124 domain-containing protein [Formivibrio citricus]
MCYLVSMLNVRPLSLLFLLAAPLAWGDIYKHVDDKGNITFTNSPMKGATRVIVESPSPRSTAKAKNGSKAQAASPSPANFPKVSSGAQKERDTNRRRILEEELAAEKRLLENQKKELSEAETNRSAEEKANPKKFLERISRLREGLVLHEKNISALQAELSRIR